MNRQQDRMKIVNQAILLNDAEAYADEHPEDPSADWDCEFKEDYFDEFIKEYAEKYLIKPL